jgi:anti-sigma B factor antagonist
MIIEEKRNGSVAIIELKGKMAGTCDAEALHEEVKSLLESNTNQIVINMQQVHWIGSLCIGALMREVISARQKDGDVYLAAPSQKVQRLFQITKLEGVVSFFPTVEEAVAAFHKN